MNWFWNLSCVRFISWKIDRAVKRAKRKLPERKKRWVPCFSCGKTLYTRSGMVLNHKTDSGNVCSTSGMGLKEYFLQYLEVHPKEKEDLKQLFIEIEKEG